MRASEPFHVEEDVARSDDPASARSREFVPEGAKGAMSSQRLRSFRKAERKKTSSKRRVVRRGGALDVDAACEAA